MFNQTIFENALAAGHSGGHAVSDGSDKISHEDVYATKPTDALEQLNATVINMFQNATSFLTPEEQDHYSSGNATEEYVFSPIEEDAFHLYKLYGPQQCEAAAFDLTDKVHLLQYFP